jgi:general stress protein CsbA
MTLDTGAVTVPPAGWYPDPAGSDGQRWWSGDAWTDHVHAPPAAEPDPQPDLRRFARDPALRSVEAEYAAAPRRDPYRDRNVLGGLALVVALLSIPGTVLDLLFPLPTLLSVLIGGAPISLAILGLVASYKLQFPTRMAWLAIAISIVTMMAGYVINAQQFGDIMMPSVTDVPGVSEITELEDGAGLP